VSRRDRERRAAPAVSDHAAPDVSTPKAIAPEADDAPAPALAGLELHRVVAPNVVASGTALDGATRTEWRAGEVGSFSRADVGSLPGAFEPVEAP